MGSALSDTVQAFCFGASIGCLVRRMPMSSSTTTSRVSVLLLSHILQIYVYLNLCQYQ